MKNQGVRKQRFQAPPGTRLSEPGLLKGGSFAERFPSEWRGLTLGWVAGRLGQETAPSRTGSEARNELSSP